ncbi:uncharacterized protein LOC144658849 [Oculina patagonica]
MADFDLEVKYSLYTINSKDTETPSVKPWWCRTTLCEQGSLQALEKRLKAKLVQWQSLWNQKIKTRMTNCKLLKASMSNTLTLRQQKFEAAEKEALGKGEMRTWSTTDIAKKV